MFLCDQNESEDGLNFRVMKNEHQLHGTLP